MSVHVSNLSTFQSLDKRDFSLQALADPYFYGLANLEDEPSMQPISKLEFDFERRKLIKDDVRELIYREILEYHPKMLREYLQGSDHSGFLYPSGIDRFKRQFAHLEEDYSTGERSTSPLQRKFASLPRERIYEPLDDDAERNGTTKKNAAVSLGRAAIQSPPRDKPEATYGYSPVFRNGYTKPNCSPHNLLKSNSISASKFVEDTH